jgi:hypothetical protein
MRIPCIGFCTGTTVEHVIPKHRANVPHAIAINAKHPYPPRRANPIPGGNDAFIECILFTFNDAARMDCPEID